jgi:cation diffusion facilitator CzcD-associated flavoprotein CzcO
MSEHEVIVIGAGVSGIGAAIKLRENGITDFVVLEKAGEVGGTWRDNTYPGLTCDVPSELYSYSFAPNPGWTRAFAGQAEIQSYLLRTVDKFDIRPLIRFDSEVLDARWDASASRWRLTTASDEYVARSLIAAAGPWHEPNLPELPGLEDFPGETFHSSRWRHDVDLAGKRVAVIGSGASAVQFVPEIAPVVEHLALFQRTPHWVLPKPDRYVPSPERVLRRRIPGARAALRRGEYLGTESLGFAFRHPRLQPVLKAVGRANIRKAIRDPELRAKVTPDWEVGCKRPLISNNYYPALARRNVDVHATGVAEIRGNVVVGADGTEVEADVIIFGTGFKILDMPVSERVYDGDGRSLADHWQGSPQAYLGTTIAGFPNLYLILGPSLGTPTSAFVIVEAQLGYAMQALRHQRDTGADTIEVRRRIQDAFNTRVQAALPATVYNSGCHSYYFDRNGRNSFSWPWSTDRLTDLLARFEPADFVIGQPAKEGAAA